MKTAARRYRALLSAPGAGNLLSASLIGRLPVGMAMLLFVLVVHAGTGSYTVAGLAAAVNAGSTSFAAPLLGRLSDRGHAAWVLIGTGLAQGASLVALVVGLRAGLSDWLIIGIAAVTGVVNPPVGAVTRTVLPRMAPDEESRNTAFALDALLVELSFVLGPAIVGVIAALSSGYVAALLAAALNVVGSIWLALCPIVRHGYSRLLPQVEGRDRRQQPASFRVEPAPDHGSRWARLIGPLSSRGLRTVLLASILWAGAFGVLEIAIPAFTTAQGEPQLGGLMFAVWSGGSIVGGVWFGGQDFRTPINRLYLILMALNVIGFGAIALAGSMWTLAILLFLAGLVISPTTALESAMVTALAPRGMTTEAFTWSGTAIYLGFALGSGTASVSLSGSLGTSSALSAASLLAVGLSFIGTLLVVAERRSLRAAAPVLVS
jgi:MFS family permease